MPHRLPLTRRSLLATPMLAAASAPSMAAAPRLPPLGASAEQAGLLFGASISREALDDPAYARLYREQTRILTTDWALKFDALRPSADVYRFEDADRLLAFARDARLPLRGHALIWNENIPQWTRRLSKKEVERAFDSHIDNVVGRYAGQLHSWDVVNEPFWPDHGIPGGWRDGAWLAAMGPSYVPRAFRRVAQVDSVAKLVLNEAHCEIFGGWGDGIRPRLLALTRELRDKGVPLHAVGLQAHLNSKFGHDDEKFAAFLSDLAKTGVDIYLTELDVDDDAFSGTVEERDRRVAERVSAFLSWALREPAVKIVQAWQLSDRYTWLRGADIARGRKIAAPARPLPFDEAFNPKPMAFAMARSFQGRRAW